MVVYDIGTTFVDIFPAADKSASEASRALLDYARPSETVLSCYSDNVGELGKAALLMEWQHPKAVPFVSHTNGVAERAIRTVEEGTRALLT